ncbi:unnamed protein product [Notodromas monacha]|uniref:Peptidase S1 domain-containing protein n=1 Tax=Notodromas monacha TaxID=399045 RepID=A0A7R9GBS7_9CRUS|nr:unnamed protein product [Notodromas monacha]CAG0916698.1 unnamed protein product [Notodromas monacha]
MHTFASFVFILISAHFLVEFVQHGVAAVAVNFTANAETGAMMRRKKRMTGLLMSWHAQTAIGAPLTAYNNEFPFVVSIRVRRTHLCGGAIVSAFHVLTSSVCCMDVEPLAETAATVVAGSHRLLESDENEQSRKIASVSIHPRQLKVSGALYAYDACIAKLGKGLRLDETVSPVPLQPALPYMGTRFMPGTAAASLVCAGWGSFGPTHAVLSNYLQRMVFRVPQYEQQLIACRDIQGFDLETMMCISGSPLLGKHMCRGDMGNPLVAASSATGNVELVGIASSILGCGRTPTVFVSVNALADWIQSEISNKLPVK